MSIVNGVIKAPITYGDVNAALGTSHTDLAAICQDPKIKMWAKYKSMVHSTIGILSDSARASNNFGIANIPTWSNLNKMGNFMLGIDRTSTNAPDIGYQTSYWTYRQPSGSSSEVFRLTDFCNAAGTYGYFHGAEAPIGKSQQDNYTINSSGLLRILFANGAQDAGTIRLDELTYPSAGYDVGNMYFGVIMRKEGSNTVYVATSHKISRIPKLGAYVDISGLNSSYNGTWYICPIASADAINFTSSIGGYTNGKFISFANEYEVIGVGTNVIKFNIVTDTLWARRDTSESTRNLYVGLIVQNANSPQGSARIDFEVFSQSNVSLGTSSYTVSNLSSGSTRSISTEINLNTLATLRSAYTVRAIVTPTNVTNYGTDSAVATVVDGRPRN